MEVPKKKKHREQQTELSVKYFIKFFVVTNQVMLSPSCCRNTCGLFWFNVRKRRKAKVAPKHSWILLSRVPCISNVQTEKWNFNTSDSPKLKCLQSVFSYELSVSVTFTDQYTTYDQSSFAINMLSPKKKIIFVLFFFLHNCTGVRNEQW